MDGTRDVTMEKVVTPRNQPMPLKACLKKQTANNVAILSGVERSGTKSKDPVERLVMRLRSRTSFGGIPPLRCAPVGMTRVESAHP
jgi:hypothetical protein